MHVISKRSHQLIEPPPSDGLGAARTTTIRLGDVLLADLNSYLAYRRALGFGVTASNVIRNALCLYLESAAHPDLVSIVGPAVTSVLLPNPDHRPSSLEYSSDLTTGAYSVPIDGGPQIHPRGSLQYRSQNAASPTVTSPEQATPPAVEAKRRKPAPVAGT